MTTDVIRDREFLFLGSRLKRLAQQMQGDVTALAQRDGIPIQPGQYPILATLDDSGPLTIGALAQSLRMSQPAITGHVDRLRAAGLIEARSGEANRRQRVVSLSAAGRRMLERSRRQVWPSVEAAVRDALHGLSGPFLDQLAALEARLAERPLSARAGTAGAAVALVEAGAADLPAIVALMNAAYRNRGPVAGWTHEAGYIDGDRITDSLLREETAGQGEGRMLLWRDSAEGSLIGCVWCAPEGAGLWYLGSLTIDPREQDSGCGRRLLAAAEAWVRARGGREIRMTVVQLRDSLIAWYQRRGYALSGETEPFPYDDPRFGTPRRDDLHFVVLRKRL